MAEPNTLTVAGFEPDVIEQRLRRFESFGIHRTGWDGDDQTTAWLVEELASLGVTATRARFTFPRVEYRRARVTWPDGTIDGVPMYDGGFTGPGGVEGDLCEDDATDLFGKIVVATSALRGDGRWTAPAARDHYEALADQGVMGVVVPSGDADGKVVLRNAEHIDRPFSLPVVQAPPAEVRGLTTAILLGAAARLEIDGDRLRSNATNVVAEVEGSDPSLAPVVVMTPKSGWFTCAAERGGGLAVWLALAEAVRTLAPPRTVQFLASSGHELHHQGLRAYLREHPDRVRGADAWLHLGASIGARYPEARFGASDEALHELVRRSLSDAGINLEATQALPVGDAGTGEAREIAEGGGRFVTFLGRHRYFHSPQDTVDLACDPASIRQWAQASWSVLHAMVAAVEG